MLVFERGLRPCCVVCQGARWFFPTRRATTRRRCCVMGVTALRRPALHRVHRLPAQASLPAFRSLLRPTDSSPRAASWSRTAAKTSGRQSAGDEDGVGERQPRAPAYVDVRLGSVLAFRGRLGKPIIFRAAYSSNQSQIRVKTGGNTVAKPGEKRLQILQLWRRCWKTQKGRRSPRPRLPPGSCVGGGALPPLRQQGADVRGADRVHRGSLFGVINQICAERSAGLAAGRRHRSPCCSISPSAIAA